MNKPTVVIPIAILIGGVIVALAIYLTLHANEPSTSSGAGDPSQVAPVSAKDHIFGNPAAPVKIIEYADFDCEYCQQFDSTMHQIIANDGASGQVAWVFRDFPIVSLHPNAMHAAEAAECVAQTAGNDVYWKFSDSLFANQPTDPTQYLPLAQAAGANADAVSSCEQNASSTVDALIQADIANGKAIGANGTPYSLIIATGQPPVVINGAWPYDAVEQEIEQELQAISTTTNQ